jgi:2',3'-cyclic-nucleotide 2'-phosphodiesterase (5'-nucleotidase family)
VRVGFIGVTTEETPKWLLPEHRRDHRFTDISDAVNPWVPELRLRGIEAIVVLAHSGAFQKGLAAAGEIVDEAAEMDDAVDVVVAGHTHSRLNLTVDGQLMVEAEAYGTHYDQIRITVDRTTGDFLAKSALLAPTTHAGIAPDPSLARLVEGYAERVAPLGDRVVGNVEHELDSDGLGQLAADAQRAFASADVAFVNPGNTRRPGLEAGPVTYAELFLVHAYEHPVLRMKMRGNDVLAVMEQRQGVKLYTSGIDGVDPEGIYTVAVNGVLAASERFTASSAAGTAASWAQICRRWWRGSNASRASARRPPTRPPDRRPARRRRPWRWLPRSRASRPPPRDSPARRSTARSCAPRQTYAGGGSRRGGYWPKRAWTPTSSLAR